MAACISQSLLGKLTRTWSRPTGSRSAYASERGPEMSICLSFLSLEAARRAQHTSHVEQELIQINECSCIVAASGRWIAIACLDGSQGGKCYRFHQLMQYSQCLEQHTVDPRALINGADTRIPCAKLVIPQQRERLHACTKLGARCMVQCNRHELTIGHDIRCLKRWHPGCGQ